MSPIRPIGPILLALALFAGNVSAAEPANFYQGKTVRIVVGLAAGGGYDLYARTLARHLGKHIPGNPAVVVENMTGAGSIIAANYLYKIAKPDGLTIGHYLGRHRAATAVGQIGNRIRCAEIQVYRRAGAG